MRHIVEFTTYEPYVDGDESERRLVDSWYKTYSTYEDAMDMVEVIMRHSETGENVMVNVDDHTDTSLVFAAYGGTTEFDEME